MKKLNTEMFKKVRSFLGLVVRKANIAGIVGTQMRVVWSQAPAETPRSQDALGTRPIV